MSLVFWKLDEGKPPRFIYREYLSFLNESGFAVYRSILGVKLIRIGNNIAKEVQELDISSSTILHFKLLAERGELKENEAQELEELFLQRIEQMTSRKRLNLMEVACPSFKRDTPDLAYYFYKNCYIEISKDGITTKAYSELDAIIWEDQIIQRDFGLLDAKKVSEKVVFARFLFNCMNQDKNRYYALISVLGYLLHKFKDPALAKAIIFCDEKVSDGQEGGTGKSLSISALTKFLNTAKEDGKNFTFSSFAFEQITETTNLLVIEDVLKNFDLEKLFPVITEGPTVNAKYQVRRHIPFEHAPKSLVSTNHSIIGKGNSFDRRKIEIEFSQYYCKERTPFIEFRHRFFNDWDSEEWLLFDNYMMDCVRFYLERGIIEPPQINIELRKLIQSTCKEFVQFMDEWLRGKEALKREAFEAFINENPDYKHRLMQKTFSSWVQLYVDYKKDIYYTERKSNGERIFALHYKPIRALEH